MSSKASKLVQEEQRWTGVMTICCLWHFGCMEDGEMEAGSEEGSPFTAGNLLSDRSPLSSFLLRYPHL